MIVLGIETSCDECAVAILDGDIFIANVVASQIKEHQVYGGVAPEVASRLHIEQISVVVDQAFQQAGLSPKDIDLVAYTNRPGLMGSLLIGSTFAKNFAWALKKPFVAVNHLLAHILVAGYVYPALEFPFLGVVASGGHTTLMLVKGYKESDVQIVGTTLDDAIGECYDKVAKAYGLNYPGGPEIDRIAQTGEAKAFHFPQPKLNKRFAGEYDLSYSGLKNAVINQRHQFHCDGFDDSLANIMASFQYAAMEQLMRTINRVTKDFYIQQVVIGGGVAANSYLRERMSQESHLQFLDLPLTLCGDNGQMIAYYGKELYIAQDKQGDSLTVGVTPRVELFRYQRPS
ncbi:tRNA (adenosine(37)-N6)-threonylcarbamoyltransferase complex transferase subunit TsaD [Entomospira entomophila]|uniref:tRNA N6-adenosine threonylcarbamoyltransferase n=1 Tax=Entomospira entomophila TaxID=2719988 RepID=A0A968G9K0_9SPIO|nr:tRNA (adenosine(37)-N6)-threonylcarbamoyltransferase complex transferase subunit TsaD [Entomospira entomophilus]NIZ41090.1 tRNA (adenosine(37)-N6)-threonylcarbamoyltransferase complex transferase subunit TsaD [Entomospira entomophilus]WDI35300.1 tRNA (adenosine(37)-N6)-threonylcarbamoyltransferase complex transferase subunit TsaD [Entomospira entomophilus]